MCSEATKNEAEESGSNLKWRELGRVKVVGKNHAVTVFEPYFETKYFEREKVLKVFELALQKFYEGKFPQAEILFTKIEKYDSAARKYIEKCHSLIRNPPENWKGVWVAETK